MINVIHIKDIDKVQGKLVYIGRDRLNRPNVYNPHLGNPFKLKPNEPRNTTLAKYKEWLYNEYQTNPDYKRRIDILVEAEKQGFHYNLICYCKPNPCHGDILKEFIQQLASY